jgi:hypothetical protein
MFESVGDGFLSDTMEVKDLGWRELWDGSKETVTFDRVRSSRVPRESLQESRDRAAFADLGEPVRKLSHMFARLLDLTDKLRSGGGGFCRGRRIGLFEGFCLEFDRGKLLAEAIVKLLRKPLPGGIGHPKHFAVKSPLLRHIANDGQDSALPAEVKRRVNHKRDWDLSTISVHGKPFTNVFKTSS